MNGDSGNVRNENELAPFLMTIDGYCDPLDPGRVGERAVNIIRIGHRITPHTQYQIAGSDPRPMSQATVFQPLHDNNGKAGVLEQTLGTSADRLHGRLHSELRSANVTVRQDFRDHKTDRV